MLSSSSLRIRYWSVITFCLLGAYGANGRAAEFRIDEVIDVGPTLSSFRVGMCLLTDGDRQYVAYYDPDHRMKVASRMLDQATWEEVVLPSKVGWDSHNSITMAVDSAHQLHVVGNMHNDPLTYFRTETAGDLRSIEPRGMTGRDENRCTYPKFLTSAEGQLLFLYRDGGSGNGRRFVNRYDASSRTWTRFLDQPLLDGLNRSNAYPMGPLLGPDHRFHMAWVWRDTPDCATNHDLSYARSTNLKHWESADGQPLRLPLTIHQKATIVDPVPSGGGLINGGFEMAFDSEHRPLLAYHKRDADGHMQLYVARFENGNWNRSRLTDWTTEVPFSGNGSMPFIGISHSAPEPMTADTWIVRYRHRDEGSGHLLFDAKSLKSVDRPLTQQTVYPAELSSPRLSFPGITVNRRSDLGESGDSNLRYVLRWESLGANRDRPVGKPLPPPSMLQVVRLVKTPLGDQSPD